MARPVVKLTKAMRQAIEIEIEDPGISARELGDRIKVNAQSVFNWRHSPCYIDELNRRLKEEWQSYTKLAQKTMLDLMTHGNSQAAYNAAKYILDSAGYQAPTEVNVNADMFNYQIDYGEDD